MQNETILNIFPGGSDQNRLVLVQSTTMCGLTHLVLRQETHSPDIGWFVQSCVAIEPGQVASLKMTLSPNSLARNPAGARIGEGSQVKKRCHASTTPKILQFAEAKSKQAS